jgi:hypothetical protein
MSERPQLPLTGPARLAAALAGEDTIPPGTLVRLRSFPAVPFTVSEVVTREKYGGDYELQYVLCYTVMTPGGQVEQRSFLSSAANVYVAEGDNPTPAVVESPAPERPTPAGASGGRHPGEFDATPNGDLLGFGDSDHASRAESAPRPDPRAEVRRAATALEFARATDAEIRTRGGRFACELRRGGNWLCIDHATGRRETKLTSREAAMLWCQMHAADDPRGEKVQVV